MHFTNKFLVYKGMLGVHVNLDGVGCDFLIVFQICFKAQLETVSWAHKIDGIDRDPLEVFPFGQPQLG